MTCNDCVHNEICQKFGGPFNINDADTSCTDFKDRARFVELPCKVGDEIFCTTMGKIYQGIVGRIELDDEGFAIITTDGYCFDPLICYHTQEAAEQALKLKERENNVWKLKPCPFCGGKAKLVDAGIEGEFQDWAVECPNCHIALLYHDDGCVSTILEAVTAWNRRAESDL